MIGVITRLSVNLTHDTIPGIYKSFITPHLDYVDIIYDKPDDDVWYKACIAITGAIQGTSQYRLYHELGLESLGTDISL